ncbi:ABC transporter ATP-binding protein [Streptomyces lavendulae]|uniref:ABC transporter ATP-binding protein n=1 Tax=Streptomyces lavendulae TaxID=1914 RepID=UPI0036D0F667
MTREPVISLSDVVKSYGDLTVLHGVNLQVRRGDLAAIVGPSGSGKSTLLNLIGTLDRATSGTIRVAGRDVGVLDDQQLSALRARHLGFIFQQYHLAPGHSALDNVADGMLYSGLPRRERRKRAAVALERVGLGHRARHRPYELSGGEKQRVAVARAVVGEPDLILADEPTGALDTKSGESVMGILRDLNTDGATIVIITHDQEIAASLPRQVWVRDGEIVDDCGPVIAA